MKKCDICGQLFDNHSQFANHVRWNHKRKENTSQKFSESAILHNISKQGEWITEEVKCSKPNCENLVIIKYRSKKGPKVKNFCSRSCSNSRGPRDENFKKKVSESMKNHWEIGTYSNIDYTLNKKFSSKIERLISDYFKNKFPIDEWKTGGNIKCGDYRLSRDLWSDKLKICFEFDGIWHFKDINNQLEIKQKKDTALEDWCIQNDYRLIRLQDGFYDNIEKILFELEIIIYKTNTKIVKLGELY
jgi:hypothetical protein